MRARTMRFFERHRRVAGLLLAAIMLAIVVVDTVRVERARHVVPAAAWGLAVGVGAAIGVLAVLVVLAVGVGRIRGKAATMAVVAAGAVWLFCFAWIHPRHVQVTLNSPWRIALAVVADVPSAAVGVLGLVASAHPDSVAHRAQSAGRRNRRRGCSTAATHAAEVWHVVDVMKPPSFDPYYIARCDCDWVGPARSGSDAEQQAFDDARAHTPNVAVQVRNPLG